MTTAAPAMHPAVRRRHSEIEIIDVDALDDDIRFAQRSVRPRLSPAPVAGPSEAGPSRDNPIVILDSDEEVDVAGMLHQAPGEPAVFLIPTKTTLTPAWPARRRRVPLRSPPPPHHAHHLQPLPPVPPLPAHIAHHHPPAIQPIAQPLPFEVQITRARRRNLTPRQPSPRAAPRSHHVPNMGLGGGLIALNRQQQIEEHRRRAEADARARPLFQRVFRAFSHILGENTPPPGIMLPPAWGATKPVEEEPAYKTSFTHPAPPPPGFTHHFDASDQEEAKGTSATRAIFVSDDEDVTVPQETSVEVTPMLVCARCMDPLVLPGSAEDEGSDKRRIWSLRCGHLLDGKCIESLMRPAPAPVTATGEAPSAVSKVGAAPSTNKGKGKAEHAKGRKGKGKARALAESDVSMASMTSVASAASISPPIPAPAPPVVDDNPIRSRLRSRRQPERAASGYSPYTIPRAATSSAADAPTTLGPLTRRRSAAQPSPTKAGGRAKGKGRARKPQVLESHEFACPVEGCGHVHNSVLMTGEDWKMDPARGALPIFV